MIVQTAGDNFCGICGKPPARKSDFSGRVWITVSQEFFWKDFCQIG